MDGEWREGKSDCGRETQTQKLWPFGCCCWKYMAMRTNLICNSNWTVFGPKLVHEHTLHSTVSLGLLFADMLTKLSPTWLTFATTYAWNLKKKKTTHNQSWLSKVLVEMQHIQPKVAELNVDLMTKVCSDILSICAWGSSINMLVSAESFAFRHFNQWETTMSLQTRGERKLGTVSLPKFCLRFP